MSRPRPQLNVGDRVRNYHKGSGEEAYGTIKPTLQKINCEVLPNGFAIVGRSSKILYRWGLRSFDWSYLEHAMLAYWTKPCWRNLRWWDPGMAGHHSSQRPVLWQTMALFAFTAFSVVLSESSIVDNNTNVEKIEMEPEWVYLEIPPKVLCYTILSYSSLVYSSLS